MRDAASRGVPPVLLCIIYLWSVSPPKKSSLMCLWPLPCTMLRLHTNSSVLGRGQGRGNPKRHLKTQMGGTIQGRAVVIKANFNTKKSLIDTNNTVGDKNKIGDGGGNLRKDEEKKETFPPPSLPTKRQVSSHRASPLGLFLGVGAALVEKVSVELHPRPAPEADVCISVRARAHVCEDAQESCAGARRQRLEGERGREGREVVQATHTTLFWK